MLSAAENIAGTADEEQSCIYNVFRGCKKSGIVSGQPH